MADDKKCDINILSKAYLPKDGDVSEKKPLNIKKKKIDKSDLGANFIPPDGGWGWIVTIAAGISLNLALTPEQSFGIMYKQRLFDLGISNTQIATIINVSLTMSYLTGLLNGVIFRRFTFRQIAFFAATLIYAGLFMEVFANSFISFLVSYSLFYGTGVGLTISASSMAVNTYFERKRRTAVAYQWGVAGLGPIITPFIITKLLEFYGVQGTALLLAGFCLHGIACALIFQPVKWHVKKSPTIPDLQLSNKGWYGSRVSLNAVDIRSNLNSLDQNTLKGGLNQTSFSTSYCEKQSEPLALNLSEKELNRNDEQEREKLPFYKKIIILFDLDLLRDFSFMNVAVGLALADFVDLNFALLTPFILSDFGYNDNQIATVMTLLGICDLFIRFAIPVVTKYIKLSNQVIFSIGAIGLCIGRLALTLTSSFWMVVIVFLWMGCNKALRIVFGPLILPDYVPLNRLPAASGLQLIFCSVLSFSFGSLVGYIREISNYNVTLNFLNCLTVISLLMWACEACLRSDRVKKSNNHVLDK